MDNFPHQLCPIADKQLSIDYRGEVEGGQGEDNWLCRWFEKMNAFNSTLLSLTEQITVYEVLVCGFVKKFNSCNALGVGMKVDIGNWLDSSLFVTFRLCKPVIKSLNDYMNLNLKSNT